MQLALTTAGREHLEKRDTSIASSPRDLVLLVVNTMCIEFDKGASYENLYQDFEIAFLEFIEDHPDISSSAVTITDMTTAIIDGLVRMAPSIDIDEDIEAVRHVIGEVMSDYLSVYIDGQLDQVNEADGLTQAEASANVDTFILGLKVICGEFGLNIKDFDTDGHIINGDD